MMSGSTENLLSNSHLSASKESLDGQYYGTQSRQTRRANQGKIQGMENKGFQDDTRGLASEMHSANDTEVNEKRATSFQHASPNEPARRHSSPDHNVHIRRERGRARHGGGRRRLSSNIEEDLRRKACLNSMKRHQSANPLPISGQEEYSYIYSTAPGRQSDNGDREKILPSDEDRRSERSSRDSREPPRRVSSSEKDNEVRNMQQTIIALERNQLEQYKKRLTLALSERAKLTGELQMLSHSLTQREMESSRHSSNYTSLEPSLGRMPSSARSARLSHSLGDLRVPEMYGDYGDISVDYENNLRLPPVPGSAQSRREKVEIPELDLRSLNSSVERISSDHIENLPEEKELEKEKDTTQPEEEALEKGNEGNKNQEEKDYFKKMVDDIWEDNLRGDVLAEERIEPKSEDNVQDEIARDSDVNNNEKPPKKRLTVEEFLTNEDSKKQPNDKKNLQQQGAVNVLPSYEDMNGASRGTSPGIYEPVESLFRPQTQANDTVEQQEKTIPQHGEGLLKLKVDDDKPRNSEDYFRASTLPIDKKNKRKEEEKHVQGKEPETNWKSVRREPNLDEKQPQHISRLGRNERRFNYMVPPGARANASINPSVNSDYLGGKETEKEVQRVPSNISDKLRYYRERLSNHVEEESSCDLADAYEREKDPEKRREIQQQAAREAAMLRREASALLFEAMNLERICDPNGRVRHVYLPH